MQIKTADDAFTCFKTKQFAMQVRMYLGISQVI